MADLDPAVPQVFAGLGHLTLHVPALADVEFRDLVAQAAVKLVRTADADGDVTDDEVEAAVDILSDLSGGESLDEVMRDVLGNFLRSRAGRHV